MQQLEHLVAWVCGRRGREAYIDSESDAEIDTANWPFTSKWPRQAGFQLEHLVLQDIDFTQEVDLTPYEMVLSEFRKQYDDEVQDSSMQLLFPLFYPRPTLPVPMQVHFERCTLDMAAPQCLDVLCDLHVSTSFHLCSTRNAASLWLGYHHCQLPMEETLTVQELTFEVRATVDRA